VRWKEQGKSLSEEARRQQRQGFRTLRSQDRAVSRAEAVRTSCGIVSTVQDYHTEESEKERSKRQTFPNSVLTRQSPFSSTSTAYVNANTHRSV
jgi:hypothetical protein